MFVVPARECGEQDEADEGENNGDDSVGYQQYVRRKCTEEKSTHKRYGNTTASLKVCATQTKFNGS